MPEEFEYFTKEKEEKEVSPGKHQEAIKYAQELKDIKNKEFPTEEDLKRAEELTKKIEMIYSAKTLERGSILKFIKKLEEKIQQEIKDAFDIHTQPDGTLAGIVKLEDDRWLNFFWDGTELRTSK